MAKGRRQFREMEVLETAVSQGAVIPCHRCRCSFTLEDVKGGNVQKEHLHEVALDGPDEPGNCRYSHRDCHKVITYGTKATTAGSSSNRIAKSKRGDQHQVKKRPLTADRVSVPGDRCRGCGEISEACTCPVREKRPAFGRRR